MDIQLKRGLLDICVLAAIRSEDSYGYKIIKDMKPYIKLSESPLYTQDVADIKGALAQIWQLQRYILSSQR